MKKSNKVFLIMLVVITFVLHGCESSKSNTIKELTARSNDKYIVHVFNKSYSESLAQEVTLMWNSNKSMLTKIEGFQFYDDFQKRNKKIINELGIKEFPTFLVFDDKKVILQTQKLDDILNLVNQ
ncbi:hypothetical protein [Paenibacillus chitinolyticus]|uniref:hypothetical protein n=1 Tax=Paenibacillus chitinolyticus TaxID=79263 RepID=UPI003667E10E